MLEHETGLLIASSDLKAAKLLFKESIFTTAIFLTQQCTKKTLKAYLAFKKQPFERTHDLISLTKSCARFDQQFCLFLDHAKILKPYVTKGRYADDYFEPEVSFVQEVINGSERLLKFTKELVIMPSSNHSIFE